MKKATFILLVLFLAIALSGCFESSQSNGEFSVDNMSIQELSSEETYFMVIPVQWSGDHTATIESVEIQRDNEDVTAEDGISYEFYGGDPDKKPGVYKREKIGDKQDIDGYNIDDKGTLILKTNVVDANKNDNRDLRVQYSVNGNKKEQSISNNTIEQLATKDTE